MSIRSSISRSISNMLDKTWQKAKGSNIKLGLLLAAASGMLLTFYSFMLRNIRNDIDKNMVLLMRGLLQTTTMAAWSWNNGLSFFPSASRENWISIASTWTLTFCTTGKKLVSYTTKQPYRSISNFYVFSNLGLL